MNRLRILVTWCFCSALACIELPEIVDPPVEVPLVVRLTSPGDTLHTNGDVPVQVVVEGGAAGEVELLLGDALLVKLSPPYSYTWPTHGVPEGEYHLTARAFRNGEAFTSPPSTVVVDRTPPQVVSRSPAPGAQDVSVRAPIRIEFSEPLLRSSVTDTSFSVTAGGTVVGHSIVVSDDVSGIEVRTSRPVTAPGEVAVSFVPDAVDRAGNRLVLPAVPWTWGVPAFKPFAPSLSALEGATDAQTPTLVAVPGTDEVFAAWSELSGGASEVFFRRWNGEAWVELPGVPQPVEPENRYFPQLVRGRTGKLFAGFAANSPGNRMRRVVEWTGAEWKEVGPNTCYGVSGPAAFALTVDAQERPLIAFDESYPGGDLNEGEVYVCLFDGERWMPVGTPRSLPGINTRSALHDLQADSEGNPIVVWIQERDDWSRAYVERWDGTNWVQLGSPISAKERDSFIASTKLAIGSDGVVHIAWLDSKFGRPSNLYVQRLQRGEWQQMGEAIAPIEGRTGIERVSLRMDGDSFPMVAWAEGGAGGSAVFAQRWTGTAWSQRYVVNANPARKSGWSPALSFDDEGAPIIAYSESDGVSTSIYFQRFNQ